MEAPMKKMLFVICTLLISVSAFATLGNSSLKGKYSFQLGGAHLNGWNASITCYDPQGHPYTVTAGGSNVSKESILGVMTFDGKGNLNGTYTQYGHFDQNASNATVVPSCTPGGSNNGYAVYDPGAPGTFTGTYSIQPTGLGAMALTISGGDTPSFVLELAGTATIRNTVFMTQYDPTTYKVDVFGSAVLQ
jgi:hypothetical protein